MSGTSAKSSPYIATRKQGTDIQFNIRFGTSAHKTLVLYPIKRVSVQLKGISLLFTSFTHILDFYYYLLEKPYIRRAGKRDFPQQPTRGDAVHLLGFARDLTFAPVFTEVGVLCLEG